MDGRTRYANGRAGRGLALAASLASRASSSCLDELSTAMGWKSVHAPTISPGRSLPQVCFPLNRLSALSNASSSSPPSTCEVSSQSASNRLLIEMRSGMEIALSSSKGLWLGRPGYGRNSIRSTVQSYTRRHADNSFQHLLSLASYISQISHRMWPIERPRFTGYGVQYCHLLQDPRTLHCPLRYRRLP